MNPAWGNAVGVMIVLFLLIFIGIWVWAWLPYHERKFDRLSRIPMNDPARNDGRQGSAPITDDEDKS
jgi:cytochrome c oxidase cbb3-type subunit 4